MAACELVDGLGSLNFDGGKESSTASDSGRDASLDSARDGASDTGEAGIDLDALYCQGQFGIDVAVDDLRWTPLSGSDAAFCIQDQAVSVEQYERFAAFAGAMSRSKEECEGGSGLVTCGFSVRDGAVAQNYSYLADFSVNDGHLTVPHDCEAMDYCWAIGMTLCELKEWTSACDSGHISPGPAEFVRTCSGGAGCVCQIAGPGCKVFAACKNGESAGFRCCSAANGLICP
jgi:hypothetical protein